MTLWCMLVVTLLGSDGKYYKTETAAHGVIISQVDGIYRVDFTKYAAEHGYQGPESDRVLIVDRDKCVDGDD